MSSFGVLSDIGILIVAVLALITSLYENIRSRNHQKLMIKPVLTKEIILSFDISNFVGIHIENVGLGPAFINWITVEYENDIYHVNDQDEVGELIEKMGLSRFGRKVVAHHIGEGAIIKSGEKLELLCIKDKAEGFNIDNYTEVFCAAKVKASYKSLYKEKFEEQLR